MEKMKGILEYPLLKAGDFSGVIPVKDPTEIPDPNIEYKLLFELVTNNPDSIAKDINTGLAEIVRVINLHIASGIPLKKIIPVIVVHAGALYAINNNAAYQKKYKLDKFLKIEILNICLSRVYEALDDNMHKPSQNQTKHKSN